MRSKFCDRDTVGTVYLKSQKNDISKLCVGDINSEILPGLIDDINDTILSNPFSGEDFYISVVEQRDLQMPNAIKRRIFKTKHLPYPEDNTLVFKAEVKNNIIRFCWDLPHHSEIKIILCNFTSYPYEFIKSLQEWMNNDLSNFGFIKVNFGSCLVEGYDEKTINKYKENYIAFLESKNIDKKTIESEKSLGFFWVPNKFFQFKDVSQKNTQISFA